jgi:hypothetical protein
MTALARPSAVLLAAAWSASLASCAPALAPTWYESPFVFCAFRTDRPAEAPTCPDHAPVRAETPRAVLCLPRGGQVTEELCSQVGCGLPLDDQPTHHDRMLDRVVQLHGSRYERCRRGENHLARLDPAGAPLSLDDAADRRAIVERYRSIPGVKFASTGACCATASRPAEPGCMSLEVNLHALGDLDLVVSLVAAVAGPGGLKPRVQIGAAWETGE